MISVLYGALLAIGQSDLKRLIAYTSISHFGFIVLGIFAMTSYGPVRLGALHGQPRVLDRRAVPHRRDAHRPSRLGADRRLRRPAAQSRRCSPGRSSSPVCRASRCPGLSSFISEFLVLVGTFTRYPAAAVVATVGDRPRRAVHPADVPADVHRARCGTTPPGGVTSTPVRRGWSRRWSPSSSRSASTPSRCSTSSTRRSTRTMQQVGMTDPAPTVAGVSPQPKGRTRDLAGVRSAGPRRRARRGDRPRADGRLRRRRRRCSSSSARPIAGGARRGVRRLGRRGSPSRSASPSPVSSARASLVALVAADRPRPADRRDARRGRRHRRCRRHRRAGAVPPGHHPRARAARRPHHGRALRRARRRLHPAGVRRPGLTGRGAGPPGRPGAVRGLPAAAVLASAG